VGTTDQGGIFKIFGNPFYNSQTSEDFNTVNGGYIYPWSLKSKVPVSTVIIKEDGSAIINLNNVFYKHPNQTDVIARLKPLIKTEIVDEISWNQISITIQETSQTAGKIILKGVDGSLLYTTTEDPITYTLKS
jgi:hypothetical protein